MDREIEGIINSEMQKIDRNVQIELKRYLTRHRRFQPMNINEISEKSHGESKKNYIRRVFSDKPLFVLNRSISEIQMFEIRKKVKLTPHSIFYNSNDKKIIIREKIELENVKFFTEIVHSEISINNVIHDMPNNQVTRSIFELAGQNFLSCAVEIIGEVEFQEAAGNIIDSFELDIELQYYGLKYNNNLPIWLEYMIEGAIYQSADNWKLAVFNYFVAFDCFVQTVYNQIHKYYNVDSIIRGIRDQIDMFVDDQVDDMVDEVLEFEYGYISDEEERDEKIDIIYENHKDKISKIRNDFYEGCDKLLQEESERIQSVCDYYTIANKRLVKEKLKDVEIEVGIDLNTPKFSGMSNMKSLIKRIERIRNDIAHGNKVEIEIRGDEFYTIFAYIVSIITQYDMDKNNWNEFVVF